MLRQSSVLFTIFLLAGLCSAAAQNVQHLSIIKPGGFPGTNLVTGVEPGTGTNGPTVTWDGPAGYCLIYGKIGSGKFQLLGPKYNLTRRAEVPPRFSNAVFKVIGPATRYAGAKKCAACHASIAKTESATAHPGAFTNATFAAAGGKTNAACIVCHTVGYKLPTGFKTQAKTPQLAGVQCESCHGPAANHVANPANKVVKPRVEIASQVCGGCHSGPSHPTFEEWNTSGHAKVVSDMNAPNRISSCGRCHSGSARLSLLHGKPLPEGDANVGIVCVTCHDPHNVTANPAQLRNPLRSTNDYFLSTRDDFAAKYDPNINICAQCHNHRGASYTDTDRAPHHSPQYNMLLGTVGELPPGASRYQPSSHATQITNQCVACHMQTTASHDPAHPAVTGHNFSVNSYNLCRSCHPLPELLVQFAKGAVTNTVADVKFGLDFWAATAAPAALWEKYGTRAWEYTTPGSLSPGGPGPTAQEQALIPDNIKKARFNMYIVLYDGSFGVHNAPYAASLLDAAESFIEDELNKLP